MISRLFSLLQFHNREAMAFIYYLKPRSDYSLLSVTYNVIGLSNVLTHQKKLVVSHKKVAETELRYT